MLSPDDDVDNNDHANYDPKPTTTVVVRKKRKSRKRVKPNPRARAIGLLVFVASSLYLYFLWRTQVFLDKLERDRDSSMHRTRVAAPLLKNQLTASTATKDEAKPLPPTTEGKYIIFLDMHGGQGTGNILNGLLAAHLFAKEFGRIVCVEEGYSAFNNYFELVDDSHRQQCQAILARNKITPFQDRIHIVNFEEPPDECALKDKFLTGGEVLLFDGNTYPRWPPMDVGLFNSLYRSKQALQNVLPYKQQPRTVVHLRSPDHEGTDPRKGLDDESLMALGTYLQQHRLDETDIPYLVTNEATWFDKMEQLFQWQHPPWHQIEHSAMGRRWGARKVPANNENLLNITQEQQMMVDWYTISQATRVYHTHSDFSISAIHFNNIRESKTIMGMERGQLILIDESWRVDGETAPLSQRTLDGKGTSNLRLCNRARMYEAIEEH